jgi:putative ABC transport system ATP-binding protein
MQRKTVTSAGVTERPPSGSSVIAGLGLVKKYGSVTALDGINVEVEEGASLAIMGPSGSGKSTLLHTLAGIIRPDGGQVLLRGERIDNWGENRLSALRRKRFGFVFQSGQLLPELPAEENVALPLMLEGLSRKEAVARARRWFAPLGLDGLEQRRPGQLSGGQAQRVAIARALAVEPAVVFADEPTGALDQATGEEVIRLLTSITQKQNAALIMVTHDADVAAHCDRILQVRDGRIASSSRHAVAGTSRLPEPFGASS